jgi:hypothetical protein
MAVTAFVSGTQTAVIGTEHFLANVNEAGVFTLHVDKNAMAAGDVLELRVYQNGPHGRDGAGVENLHVLRSAGGR